MRSHQGCQVQFRTSRRNVGILWRCCTPRQRPRESFFNASRGPSPSGAPQTQVRAGCGVCPHGQWEAGICWHVGEVSRRAPQAVTKNKQTHLSLSLADQLKFPPFASWLSSHGRGLGPRDALKMPGLSLGLWDLTSLTRNRTQALSSRGWGRLSSLGRQSLN